MKDEIKIDNNSAEITNDNSYIDDINIDNIDDPFPNLLEILNLCKTKNIHHKLFNRSTKENERCHRGLLVIFKHKEIL